MARGRGNFGLSSARGGGSRGSFRGYRGGGSWRGGRGGRGRGGAKAGEGAPKREDDGTQLAEKFEQVRISDELDEKLGFARVQEGLQKEGWLVNMHPVCHTRLLSRITSLCTIDAGEGRGMAVWQGRS